MTAIIDTGASVICLDRRVALELGLQSIYRKPMEMADGSVVEATSYRAEMQISELGFSESVQVFALPMHYPSRRVLLGRSFLKRYWVNYEGPTERFHFYDASQRFTPVLGDHDE